ncbi:MAG: G8 domain-containing protein [Planctomycetota bacterium]
MHTHQALLELLPHGAEDAAAVQSGAWSDQATWGGQLPAMGESILIPAGVTVIYDVNDDNDRQGADTTRFHTIRVDGRLAWQADTSTRLYVDTLFSSPTGEIIIGDELQPIAPGHTAEIVIIADTPMDPLFDRELLGRGFIPHGMTHITGAEKTPHAALAGDAFQGSTVLELREPPIGWRVGDQLVLGGTSYDPNGSDTDNTRFRDEVLVIEAIDGRFVTFANTAPGQTGLRWDHVRPSGRFFSNEDLTLYVANLTRNVVFRSELDPQSPEVTDGRLVPGNVMDVRRGHQMAMHNADQEYRNAAFIDFGRLNKEHFIDDPATNVDGTAGTNTNTRGRYVIHLHRNLPRNNQPVDFETCSPSIISGCVAWGSPGWGIVHHDSYAIIEDNVVFDVLGAGFVQEAGNEIGTWRNNISIKTTGDSNPDLTVEPFGDGYKRVTNFDFGFNGEAYWIQGASQVEFIDNIAISAAGGGVDIFSDVDANSNRDAAVVPREHLPLARQHIVTADSGLITVNRVPANTFTGFEVYNSDFGLLTWNHMRNQGEWVGYVCPCDGNTHRVYAVLEDFKFWNIYGQGIHFQYSSQIELRNGIIASSDLATPGINDKPTLDLGINGDGRGYGIGMNGPTKRLKIQNVVVEGWRFGVRTPLEGQINTADGSVGDGNENAMGLPHRRSEFTGLKLANNTNHFYRRQNGFTQITTFPNHLIIADSSFETDTANQPPVATITAQTLSPSGTVRLSGLPSSDPDTPDQYPPYDPRTVLSNDPNNIVAYAWDLDSDGTPDAFGETIHELLPSAGSTVTLTVYDHQGLSNSTTHLIEPTNPSPASELLIDSAFDRPSFYQGIYALDSSNASMGWHEARATLQGNSVLLAGQYGFSSIAQAIYSNTAHRGGHRLAFDYEIQNAGSFENTLTVHVFGINGEFGSRHAEAEPRQLSAIPVEIVPLYSETFVGTTPSRTIQRDINFGLDGYDYIYIGFAGNNVSSAIPNDHIRLDNASLRGAACSRSDLAIPYGTLTAEDIVQFIALLQSEQPSSDYDADGQHSALDLLYFLRTASTAECNQ